MAGDYLQDKGPEFFYTVLQSSNSPFVITNALLEDNPIIFVNHAFESTTGYAAHEVIGKNCRFLQGNDRSQSSREILANAIRQGSTCECTVRNYRKKGEMFWNQLFLFPVKDRSSKITNFVGVQHDISAAKSIMVALEEIQAVVDNIAEGIIVFDMHGTIQKFNQAASDIFGYSTNAAIGCNISTLITLPGKRFSSEAGSAFSLPSFSNLIGRRDTEVEGRRHDKAPVPLEITITKAQHKDQTLFVGIVRDITEKKRGEKIIKDYQTYLQAQVEERTSKLMFAVKILEAEVAERKKIETDLQVTKQHLLKGQELAHVGSWHMDWFTGHQEWSDELYRIYGFAPQSFKASLEQAIAIVHPEDREHMKRDLTNVFEGASSFRHERRIVRPDGELRYVLSLGEIVRDASNNPILLSGTVLDITEQKLAEQAILASQERLREFSAHQEETKEEERKRIAREIHDELGGLLTGVQHYLSFAIERMKESGQHVNGHLAQASDMISDAMRSVQRIIADLRPSVLDQLGLWPAIEWYAREVQSQSGIECLVSIDEMSLCNVDIPPAQSTAIFRIVQEALTNIVRHSRSTKASIWATWQTDHIVIEIIDNGIGFQTTHAYHGASWGLIGMQERARHFGGEVDVDGTTGGGTSVVVRLPLKIEQ